ncbi:hypothetical protein FKP32DRAFT_596992 [Trametes sanguinea]|nr:hypothetical protein FKP32DRAFT_596992 [Trametes sanguinea]
MATASDAMGRIELVALERTWLGPVSFLQRRLQLGADRRAPSIVSLGLASLLLQLASNTRPLSLDVASARRVALYTPFCMGRVASPAGAYALHAYGEVELSVFSSKVETAAFLILQKTSIWFRTIDTTS